MSDLNPTADDPFAVLGVSPRTPLQEIKAHAMDLNNQHERDESITAINEAFEAIKNGHHVTQLHGTLIEPLVLDVASPTVTVGERLPVTVTDIEGNPVADAEISVNGVIQGQTDAAGSATVVIQETGEAELSTHKPNPRSGFEFKGETVTVPVEKQQRSLTFASCPESATVGESIPIEITDDDGNGVAGVTVRTPQTVSNATDSDGMTTVTLSATGTDIELVASKSGSSNRAYRDAKTTIDVARREVDLSIDGVPATVSFDDSVQLRVVNGDGDGVKGVTVSIDGKQVTTTDADGTATIQFDTVDIGQLTIEASKRDRGGERFCSAEKCITVTENELALTIESRDDAIVIGETATFEVRDEHGEAIEGAYVSGTDGGSDMTDENGLASVSFDNTGNKTVSASTIDDRPGYTYESDTCTVSVEPETETLVFDSLPDSAPVDETIGLVVTTGGGTPVDGAIVTIDGGTQATTDDEGRAYVTAGRGGERSITASKPPTDDVQYEPAEASITIERERRSLEFIECPTTAFVGEPIEVRVAADGTPVRDATVKSAAGDEASTNRDGTAQFTPTTSGMLVVAATKEDTDKITYVSDTDGVDVIDPDGQLSFADPPTEVAVGEPARFRVVDDGSGIGGVTVSAAGETATTGPDGAVTLEFDTVTTEPITVTATKNEPDGEQFVPATTTLLVTENVVDLNVEQASDRAVVTEPVEFIVTDDAGNPIESALVSAVGGGTDQTDASGRATVTVESSGTTPVSVSKTSSQPGYTYESTTMTVSVERRTEQLTFRSAPDSVTVGETVAVVVETNGGEPVAGVTVTPDDGTQATTDDHGTAYVSFFSAGEMELTASKPPTDRVRYNSGTESVVVETDVRSLAVDVCTEPVVGETVQVRVTDENGPVKEATVDPENGTKATTGTDGTAFIKFYDAGEQQVTVSKSSQTQPTYEPCTATVSVSAEATTQR